MNKYIHPRNPYKKPPDFKALAEQFPKLKSALLKESGKFDFSNRSNSIALARCLLKKDFGLDIEFPENSLSPSLTLKLNYLLWIEDIIKANPASFGGCRDVQGLDIGCGAAVLFPALAAAHLGWKMLGVESNQSDQELAAKNVLKNDALAQKVKVFLNNDPKKLFEYLFDGDVIDQDDDVIDKLSFTMCNPPFYNEDEYKDMVEKEEGGEEVVPAKVPAVACVEVPAAPAPAGRRHEMTCEGGELAFVNQMMTESFSLGSKVRIFTTMLGHKRSLGPLKSRLAKAGKNVKFVSTELCQGKTMRWALAWTMDKTVSFEKVKSSFKQVKAAKKAAEPFLVNLAVKTTFKEVFDFTKGLVNEDLRAIDVAVSGESGLTFRLTKPSWRNQRSKRRKLAKSGEFVECGEGEAEKEEQQKERVEMKEEEGDSETLLKVSLDLIQPQDKSDQVVCKFTCDESSALGRGGLYELVQYFKNKWQSVCSNMK